ncbi:PorT family protein [Dysgonomonas sp. 216]|uniref:outer membrane beta-barrel protein n=1 Tax=Dysgonomonas sp. 216 TaxID=2302934 RepID=UPI0013D7E8CB|nr:outer membrane beta-barrel protein [Dysgonomonas sp. 216]NDW19324.1 PorT family protein [Dysgonomonas sp. 216]
MKNRKKAVLVYLLLFCLNINLLAQTPIRFGVKAGLNMSTAFVEDASESKFRLGYKVGATAEYSFNRNFMIQSGLFFSVKGSKLEDLNVNDYVGGTPDFTHTFNQLYLELPLYGSYKLHVRDNLNVVLGAGPYIGYGIGGKTKQKLNNGTWSNGVTQIEWDTFGDGVFDENRDWLRGESLKRFDFGAGIKADLEYCKYILGVEVSSSVINIADKPDYKDFTYHNFNVCVSLGYKF